MKQKVNPFDYAGNICEAMSKGILLTTKVGEKVNTMTIGWGTIGIEWGRPVFVAYVRETRFTREMLDRSGEFTVNIPLENVDRNILAVCGTKSGRDMDKFSQLNLTQEPGETVDVPGILELPLTLECKVLYKVKQSVETIPQAIQARYYPADESGFQDYHYAYFGEITNAYIVK